MDVKRIEQICIEDRLSKKNIRKKVMKDIDGSMDILKRRFDKGCEAIKAYKLKSYYESKQVRVDRLKDITPEELMLEIMIAVMPTASYQPIQAIAGKLLSALGYKDVFDGIKTAAELLAVACVSDIYDIHTATSSETGSMTIVNNYPLNESTLNYIDQTCYLPPMVCAPEIIKSNNDSGYLTIKDTVLLGKNNYHDKTLALDVLNILNQQKLELYVGTLAEVELPKKPIEDPEQQKAFDNMVSQSNEMYDYILEQDNEFYFCWKYDKRGRVYSSGYHINLQASQYKKSLINLKHKELING